MSFDNRIELFEAVYLFNEWNRSNPGALPIGISQFDADGHELNESILKSLFRILAVNDLLDFDGTFYHLSSENMNRHRRMMEKQQYKSKIQELQLFYHKAINPAYNFFENLSDLEYDIYSRWDFEVTSENGSRIAQHLDLNNKRVLELGGNSGGLATALLKKTKNCSYTVVDMKIPCAVGNLLKVENETDIQFIDCDVFKLNLTEDVYDYVILMNLIHDYNDLMSINLLKNAMKYGDSKTRIVIIEDVLVSVHEPQEAIMEGLRLAVECKGGRQRTVHELSELLSAYRYKLENQIYINPMQTMLIYTAL